jgi:hypothetical protein
MAHVGKQRPAVKSHGGYADGFADGYESGFRDGSSYPAVDHEQSENTREDSVVHAASNVVRDFARVVVAPGLNCPVCGRAFSPHAMIKNGVAIILRCDHCHADALVCEPERGR